MKTEIGTMKSDPREGSQRFEEAGWRGTEVGVSGEGKRESVLRVDGDGGRARGTGRGQSWERKGRRRRKQAKRAGEEGQEGDRKMTPGRNRDRVRGAFEERQGLRTDEERPL